MQRIVIANSAPPPHSRGGRRAIRAAALLGAGALAVAAAAAAPASFDDWPDGATIRATSATEPDADGRLTRIAVFETGFKYPLIRVTDWLVRDPATGSETRTRQEAVVADHILVKLRPGATEDDLAALNRRHDGRIRSRLRAPGLFLVAFPDPGPLTVDLRAADYSGATGVVLYAESDPVGRLHDTTPSDPMLASQWALPKIHAPQAWDWHTGSTGVVVAMIDSGIDYTHPDLSSNIWRNPGEIPANGQDDDANGFVDDVVGWDFYSEDDNPCDSASHGTLTAGIVGAVGDNAIGIAGVNWRVRLMALKFTDAAGNAVISDAIEAVHYATLMRQRGAAIRVANNSYGFPGFSQVFRDAVADAGAAGILFAASAGNLGRSIEVYPEYPASFDLSNIIAVANTQTNDVLNPDSNYGTPSVDLGAPGTSILTTAPGGGYATGTGTSYASPIVAGAAALLFAVKPTATVDEVRNAVLGNVDSAFTLFGKIVTGGRLNVDRALRDLRPGITHVPLLNTTNTTNPYAVDAEVTPPALLDTNRVWLLWNTSGSAATFATQAMARVTNDLYRAFIPAQPLGATVSYYLRADTLAAAGGRSATNPAAAPAALHSFRVVVPVTLIVTGAPATVGAVVPDYGTHAFPSGVTVNASAPTLVGTDPRWRHDLIGWEGAGSVPATGDVNSVSFTLRSTSAIAWQWDTAYALTQTSTVAGVLATTSWWRVNATAASMVAPACAPVNGTNFCFAEWRLDGARQPDDVSKAVNPLDAVLMNTSRVAVAVYLDEAEDGDGDELADWWERFYFGTNAASPADDGDDDGHGNLMEFGAGTDPRDADSVLRFNAISLAGTGGVGQVVVEWHGVAGRLYSLSSAASLTNQDAWAVVPSVSNLPGIGASMSYTDVVSGVERRLFRIGVVPP